jgi:N-acetylglutamate synthase
VEAWYRVRGLPPMIVIPGPLGAPAPDGGRAGDPLDALLAGRGWRVRATPAVVMTAGTGPAAGPGMAGTGAAGTGAAGTGAAGAGAAGTEAAGTEAAGAGTTLAVTFAARPDEAWLARYRYRGTGVPAAALRLLLSAPWQAFASVVAGGETVAVGRVSVAAGWAGITAVDVDPRFRRRGLATAVTRALAAEAAGRGASRVFLQVEEDNLAARALYARCGFADAHRYHYRVAPARDGLRDHEVAARRGRSRRRSSDL